MHFDFVVGEGYGTPLQLIAQAAPTIDHPATSLVRGAQSRSAHLRIFSK
jgi:hypothetical protein